MKKNDQLHVICKVLAFNKCGDRYTERKQLMNFLGYLNPT